MDQSTVIKILDIQRAARNDAAMQPLLAEYKEAGDRLSGILPALTPAQRDAVMDYIAVFGALHLRMLELAVETQT